MCKVKYNHGRQAFEIELEVWGGKKKIPIYVDDEKTAAESEQIITEKIDRINRNREKISRIVFDYYSLEISSIAYRLPEPYESFKDTFEEFAGKLYISKIFADIYEDGEIIIYFTVKSRKNIALTFLKNLNYIWITVLINM
ncbi:MAG: hypothetical protein K2J76_00205 [Oscillospiraceae bacterium]|nr:hypothetical protein [Oscillospiraceae bacterium]